MATFVLVQPAWMGGWCWNKVAPRLRQQGHQVYTLTLTGLAERAHLAKPDVGLSTHIEDVAAVVRFDDLHDVVLVGTSSGGTVITGVASGIPDRIASLVYLDAFLPSGGQCTLDLLPAHRRASLEGLVETEGNGWLLPRFASPPWPVIVRDMWLVTDDSDVEWMLPRLRPTPVRHFTEPLRTEAASLEAIGRTYIRCTRTPAPPFDQAAALVRSRPDWRYRELDAGHLSYITHPEEVTAMLLEISAKWE